MSKQVGKRHNGRGDIPALCVKSSQALIEERHAGWGRGSRVAIESCVPNHRPCGKNATGRCRGQRGVGADLLTQSRHHERADTLGREHGCQRWGEHALQGQRPMDRTLWRVVGPTRHLSMARWGDPLDVALAERLDPGSTAGVSGRGITKGDKRRLFRRKRGVTRA
eukprot:scaffold55825_cov27-Tisochrysis_lutea.AAC.6